MKYIPILAILVFLTAPHISEAGPVIRSGDSVSVGDDQILQGDFYGAGETIIVSGVAENDVVVAGSNVTLNGKTMGDVAVAGMTVNIHGEVADDVRIVGGDVKVASTIKGDLVVAGAALTILSTATIEGDLIFWGGELTVEGAVLGSMHGSAETVRIDGPVGGDVEFAVQNRFALGDKAQIEGDLIYSGAEVTRGQNAVVVGDIQYDGSTYDTGGNSRTELFLFTFVIVLFSALSMYFVARKQIFAVITQSEQRFGFNGLIGLATFLVMPFVSVLLLVSMVGSIVGMFLLFAYMAALLLSVIIAIVMIGHLFQKYILKNSPYTLITPFVGALGFALLIQIPVVGVLTVLAILFITLGAMVNTVYHTLRS